MIRLNELRGNKTQAQIAQILGLPRETYRNYEVGNREPPLDTLLKIANYFGVSVDYLLGRDEVPGVQMKPAAESELTETEQELLSIYRSVNPALQDLILNVARTAAGNPTDPNSQAGAMALKKQA